MAFQRQSMRELPVRLFARVLGYLSNLRFKSEHERLELLLSSLPEVDDLPASQEETSGNLLMIVIPFKDKWQLTDRCVASLVRQDFEPRKVKVVLVDNNSCEPETKAALTQWKAQLIGRGFECELLKDASPFNFSGLNNRAVLQASADFAADFYLFLNNDVEFTVPEQLSSWLAWHRSRPKVGITGTTLLYPDKTLQHACVLPGFKIVATHPLRNLSESLADEWCKTARCVPAVTGAALMIRQPLFTELGFFDEALAHACQDVDLCLKSLKAGFENWIVPQVKLIHHESATRKAQHNPDEVNYFYQKWEQELQTLCPIAKKLSRWVESPTLSLGEGEFPWRLFQ